MTDTYNDALSEQLHKNVWDELKSEALNMSPIEYATITTDIAGIFDPTPISDAAGFALSVMQGDALGALLSGASMLPYAGDAVAKPLKIAKVAPKTAKALKSMLHAGDKLASMKPDALKQTGLKLKQVAAARKKALEEVQKAMLAAKQKIPGCKKCKLVGDAGEKRRMIMPQSGPNGNWTTKDGMQPKDGTCFFRFTDARTLPDGRKVEGIQYRNGAPMIKKYAVGKKRYDLWEVSGNAETDRRRLKEMMLKDNPLWEQPSHKEYVLHHFEDGKVGFVPRVIHDVKENGVSHTGGNSMINNQLF